jgi:deoxyuridine 5'-triphosphate nucleotidohydrolase
MNDLPVFKFALREDLVGDERFLPKRATNKSTGYDVSCAFETHKLLVIQPGEYVKIPLGFTCVLPEGYWLFLSPRSSSFTKKHLHALYGIVDSDYRGHMFFCAKFDGNWPITLEFGERIGQLIPFKVQEMVVEQISTKEFQEYVNKENNDRKDGGFGSSDENTKKK